MSQGTLSGWDRRKVREERNPFRIIREVMVGIRFVIVIVIPIF